MSVTCCDRRRVPLPYQCPMLTRAYLLSTQLKSSLYACGIAFFNLASSLM